MRSFVVQSVSLTALLGLAVLDLGADAEAGYMSAGSSLTTGGDGGLEPELPRVEYPQPRPTDETDPLRTQWALFSLNLDGGSAGASSASGSPSGSGGPPGFVSTVEMPPPVLMTRLRTADSPPPPDPIRSSIFKPPRISPLL